MIRIIADQFTVTIVTDNKSYVISYDDIESFEALVALLNDLGFEAKYELSIT